MKPSSLFYLVTGLLIGYSVHRKSLPCDVPTNQDVPINQDVPTNQDVPQIYNAPQTSMDWSDLVTLLNDKLSSIAIEEKLRYL